MNEDYKMRQKAAELNEQSDNLRKAAGVEVIDGKETP